MGYLHLWYANFDPTKDIITKIKDTKDYIRDEALNRMDKAGATSNVIEKEFEKWYRIPSQTELDGQIDTSNFTSTLKDLDSAAAIFKNELKKATTLKEKRAIINKNIEFINDILDKDAKKGFTTEAALQQIKVAQRKMEEALPYFDRGADHKKGDNLISEAISTMETHTAGYVFELADNLGFLTASKKGLSDVHDLYINIGGSANFANKLRTVKEDPEFEKELNMLADVLESNGDTLSKGDQILFYHTADGQGNIGIETKYAVFQDKNYTNIRNVTVAEKTFAQLRIGERFGATNLVNIAAGLGNNATGYAKQIFQNRKSKKIEETGVGFKNTMPKHASVSEKELDTAWQKVRESTRLLAISDAIAGDINANFTMRPNYYVIRSRTSGEVHVVGVSSILNKITTDLRNGLEGSMGIKWDYSDEKWQTKSREFYWMYNIGNFNPGQNPEAAEERSKKAYSMVLDKINSQKVRISLNFSAYFMNY